MGLNPVERRLAYLCGEWTDFRDDSSRRLLLWQVPGNGMRMVECFVEAQKHETPYTSGDLFIVFKAPFVHGMQYARALKEELAGQYNASRDDLSRQGLSADWPFDPAGTPDSAPGFGGALASLQNRYRQAIPHVAAVLLPPSITSAASFVEWVRRLLASGLPEPVRVLLPDSQDHSRFDALAAHPLVSARPVRIDATGAARETFAQEPNTGDAGLFRNLLMNVVAMVEKGTADQTVAVAGDALMFARRRRWLDQEVVVRMLVAGAFLKESRHAEAVSEYSAARQAATQAADSGHPAGLKLVLQTWFGEAGTHFAAGNPTAAARCYDEAAVVAGRAADPVLRIEALRMGAFCMARACNAAGAIERGNAALDTGSPLPPEQRATTTLPVAVVDQLRVHDPGRVERMQEAKSRLHADIEAARQGAEQAQPAPGGLEKVERQLEFRVERAREQCAETLAELASRAAAPFRDLVARANQLMGADWMVDNDIALPAAVVKARGAAV